MILILVSVILSFCIILGTPGTGKSTLCEELSKQSELTWLNIGQIAKDNDYFEGYDDEYQCKILDEDKVKLIKHLQISLQNKLCPTLRFIICTI